MNVRRNKIVLFGVLGGIVAFVIGLAFVPEIGATYTQCRPRPYQADCESRVQSLLTWATQWVGTMTVGTFFSAFALWIGMRKVVDRFSK